MKTNVIHFDSLPDSAMVSVKTVSALLGVGESTVWRRADLEPDFPQPIRLGTKCTRWKVGDIRAFVKEKSAA